MKGKYHKVKYKGINKIMAGSDISLLQQSGASIKIKHRVYKCISCNSWVKNPSDCSECGFDASIVDTY